MLSRLKTLALIALFAATCGCQQHKTLPEPVAQTLADQAQAGQMPVPEVDCVVLLHGLARTTQSMEPLAEQLRAAHYRVVNQGYPSREFPIAELAGKAIPPALAQCRAQGATRIHFVTHSLGGIVLRQYLLDNAILELARVVMFAPPNQGSQVVDKLKNLPGFYALNGPAGMELGTDPKSVPMQLAKRGPVDFDLGVIAGTRSINLILSLYLPSPDDGKVSVASTRIDGMRDFIALPVSHPFIMKDETAIAQTLHYLQYGRFLQVGAGLPKR